MPPEAAPVRRVCFVTGTRAEFGLMRPVLRAIQAEPHLKLQLVATGMHLDPAHGRGADAIRDEGWTVDRIAPWEAGSGRDRVTTARNTGQAVSNLAGVFADLRSDVVMVVGDRVEAFAAASAAHICGLVLAHVHGGDRAAGQVDDSLRHAITKLAHVHFPATRQSARRLRRLGEDRWRIHAVGSPAVDGIVQAAAPLAQVEQVVGPLTSRRYALLVLHPVDADEQVERARAELVFGAVSAMPYEQIVIIHPNNDPGSRGVAGFWDELPPDPRVRIHRDVPRSIYLGLLNRAAVLVGNSSSGIIEAASFHAMVVDIGPRQRGREHGGNVTHVPYDPAQITAALRRLWHNGHPLRFKAANVYGGAGAGTKIARILADLRINDRLLRKLIVY